jgi:hypothetical protein
LWVGLVLPEQRGNGPQGPDFFLELTDGLPGRAQLRIVGRRRSLDLSAIDAVLMDPDDRTPMAIDTSTS